MSAAPIDDVLSRLDDPRPNGRERWRAACPVCGGKNRSTLSIGVGESGCVLLRCWKSGCGPDEIASALGLDVEALFPPREASAWPSPRRRLVTATQALALLEAEALVVFVVASDVRRGVAVGHDDWQRFLQAIGRIGELRAEVYA